MAVAVLLRAVAVDPQSPDLHRYLGVACRSLGWNDAAETALRRSFGLDKASSDTAYNLAVLLATLDKPRLDEAKDWYKKARELGAPADPALDQVLGK